MSDFFVTGEVSNPGNWEKQLRAGPMPREKAEAVFRDWLALYCLSVTLKLTLHDEQGGVCRHADIN
jgi:hypothetical protein